MQIHTVTTYHMNRYLITNIFQVNYVVLFGDMLEKSSYKQRQAVRHNVPVLRCEFITDCIEQKQILPTATYAVGEPISGKNFKKGRISKSSWRNFYA